MRQNYCLILFGYGFKSRHNDKPDVGHHVVLDDLQSVDASTTKLGSLYSAFIIQHAAIIDDFSRQVDDAQHGLALKVGFNVNYVGGGIGIDFDTGCKLLVHAGGIEHVDGQRLGSRGGTARIFVGIRNADLTSVFAVPFHKGMVAVVGE